MSPPTASQDHTQKTGHRTYIVTLEESSSSNRVRNFIQEHTGVSRQHAEDVMQNPPSVIAEHLSLQEAVALRNQLMRLGATVRVQEVAPESTNGGSEPEPEDVQSVSDNQAQTSQSTPKDLNQYFHAKSTTPNSAPKLGVALGGRLWTCLISVVVVAVVLALITIWMLDYVGSKTPVADRASGRFTAEVRKRSALDQTQQSSDWTAHWHGLRDRAQHAIDNANGAEASKVLAEQRELQALAAMTEALGTSEAMPAEVASVDDEGISRHQQDQEKAIPELSPSILDELQQLSGKHHLENDPAVGWEITGTNLTGRTNLPESTNVDVQVRIPGAETATFHRTVSQEKIVIAGFHEFPVGTILVEMQVRNPGEQPTTVRNIMMSASVSLPDDLFFRAHIDIEEEIQASRLPTLHASLNALSRQLASDGYESFATQMQTDAQGNSFLRIQGESRDTYLFLKNSVLAAGNITQSISDPPDWILIEVNGERYWIESVFCRKAVRDFSRVDPGLDDFILNNLAVI
jgi:hypothetical protein